LDCNKGCLGKFETAFDGEIKVIADIMEYAIDNQIPGNLTIHSDAQASISRVEHTGTRTGQGRAVRVVQAVQRRIKQDWCTRIEWALGYSGIEGNETADQLAGEAASEKR
jgi:ribonuclease HI